MTNLGKKLEIFVIVAVIALIGIVYAFTRKPVLAPTNTVSQNQNLDSQQQVPNTVITYIGVDGKNALELLKANHRVEAKEYSFGSFVTSIDGTAPDSSHFWALYINNELSQVAADTLMTKSTDTIKWQID